MTCGSVLGCGFIVVAAWAWIAEGRPVVGLLIATSGVLTLLETMMPRVVITPEGLEVRNLLRTRRVHWSEVQGVEAGWSATTVRLHSGMSVRASAVTKSIVRKHRHVESRADAFTREIATRLAARSCSGAHAPTAAV